MAKLNELIEKHERFIEYYQENNEELVRKCDEYISEMMAWVEEADSAFKRRQKVKYVASLIANNEKEIDKNNKKIEQHEEVLFQLKSLEA